MKLQITTTGPDSKSRIGGDYPRSSAYNPPESLLQRHLAFWNLEEVDRPLVGVYLGGYLANDIYEVAQEGSLLLPDQIAPERFFELFWQDYLALQRIDQDLIYPVQPLSSVPWLEGMLGCPIRVQAQSVWAEPALAKGMPLETFEPRWCQEWLDAALRFVNALIAKCSPFYPVAGPFLRGPADIIAAMIGTDRLCYELIDNPSQIHRLARISTEAWVKVSRQIIPLIPPWMGGYVFGARWIYAPDHSTYCSEDTTVLLSPAAYRKFFLPYNRIIAQEYPYGFWHRHSTSTQHLLDLLDLNPGWAIEVTMDPTGPQVSEILPILQRIQQAGRPLIVFGLNDPDEVGRLVAGLSPRGLCVTVQADTEDQAKQLIAVARKTYEKAVSRDLM
jgi:hypothetical protein